MATLVYSDVDGVDRSFALGMEPLLVGRDGSEVLQAIRRVRHGYVQVIVQDGKAIQIDTMEKKRLDRPAI